MVETNLAKGEAQTNEFKDLGAPLLWQVDYNHSQSNSQLQFTFSSPSQHFLGILLSLLPFKRNLPFTRRPNSCVVVWQQLTYWLVFLASLWWLLIFLSLANENWSLCRYASDATFTTSSTFCGVSLLTMTAISVDRLLALLLGLRYRQTVTLKRTYIMIAAFWILSSLTGLCCILNYRIALWLGHISISLLTQRFFVLSVIIRLKNNIMSNNSWANQMHWTWWNTEKQCTVHCGCSLH